MPRIFLRKDSPHGRAADLYPRADLAFTESSGKKAVWRRQIVCDTGLALGTHIFNGSGHFPAVSIMPNTGQTSMPNNSQSDRKNPLPAPFNV
jgi:hypothetical protein